MKKTAKTSYIQIRLTPAEKDVLFALAANEGKSVSEFLRQSLQSRECNEKNNGINE